MTLRHWDLASNTAVKKHFFGGGGARTCDVARNAALLLLLCRSRFARFQLASQSNNYLSPPSWHMSVPDPPVPPALLGTDESLEYPQIAPASGGSDDNDTQSLPYQIKQRWAPILSHTHCQSEKKKQIAAALSFVLFCF